jgi:glycosyltransferase involved in cell wall biosynthesis
MYSKLDVQTNTNIKFHDNFYVKYYDETKVDKFSWQLFTHVWKDIKSADIVHIQAIFNTPTPISLIYAKLFNKPIVLSPRGSLGNWCIDNGSRFKNLWLHYLLKPLVKNIQWHATAQQEANEIHFIYPDANVTIIPNGIEYNKFQKANLLSRVEYLKKYTKKDLVAEKVVVSMGRIQKKKGFDILINAFHKMLNTYPSSVLLIAGNDEGEQKVLEKQIESLKLDDSVYFIGSIEGQDKIDFLANADLFVLPSHNENFGNVYIESLATGTPIVASKGTPWSEVEEYNCGAWVDNTVLETANAMLRILEMNREEMKINSKLLAKKYDWKVIAQDFKRFYIKVLEQK